VGVAPARAHPTPGVITTPRPIDRSGRGTFSLTGAVSARFAGSDADCSTRYKGRYQMAVHDTIDGNRFLVGVNIIPPFTVPLTRRLPDGIGLMQLFVIDRTNGQSWDDLEPGSAAVVAVSGLNGGTVSGDLAPARERNVPAPSGHLHIEGGWSCTFTP